MSGRLDYTADYEIRNVQNVRAINFTSKTVIAISVFNAHIDRGACADNYRITLRGTHGGARLKIYISMKVLTMSSIYNNY